MNEKRVSGVSERPIDGLKEPWWEPWPDPQPDLTYAIWINDEPVSAVRIFERLGLQCVDDKAIIYDVVGIGGVFTDPEYRGNGYASELITAALRYYSDRYTAAVLFCRDDLCPFYRDSGFWKVGEQFGANLLAFTFGHVDPGSQWQMIGREKF